MKIRPNLLLLPLVLGILSAPAHAGPMDLSGQFAVSESGAATYTIPIQVPPGTGGMEPRLALAYNSQGGNGLLGVGWSLSGLSVITRCPRTMAQDGVRGGVNFDLNDRYCLDGQRLIAISGANGAANTEYRTERESFAKIVSYGSAGNGPASFKVWTKDGLVMEYGATANSAIEAQGKTSIAVWAVNKVSDVKGNYYTVSYTKDSPNGAYYPTRIDYTGNASTGLAPNSSVQFAYESRPDVVPGYLAGSMIRVTNRLQSITTSQSAIARKYTLSYSLSVHTDRSRLASLKECDGAGNCLPTNTFSSFESGTKAFQGRILKIADFANWTDSNSDASAPRMLVDVNGDGLPDVVGFGREGVWVSLNTGTSFAARKLWIADYGSWTENNKAQAPRMLVDVNGDGLPDVVGFGKEGVWVSLASPQPLVDSMAGLTNGLGGSVTLNYKSLIDGTFYTKGAGSKFPVLDLQFPMYAVSSVAVPNGIGGTLTTNYKYGGLKADVGATGRGLLGFAWQESKQAETGHTTRTEYRQDWPYVGLPSRVTRTLAGSGKEGVLGDATTTYGCLDPASGGACAVAAGKRYFPYVSQSVESGWDLNGAALPVTTTTQQFDIWGNATQIKVGTSDGHSKTTTNTYQNDSANWRLGRLLRSQVQSTAP
jgi:hypothetical protein